MSVKAKTAPENQLTWCAYYYYYSWQTLTIWFNHSNMIVHTWAKHYREDCFSCIFSVFDRHITDMWLGLITKVQESLFVGVRMRHEWGFWHQNVTGIWSLDDYVSYNKDVIAGPEYTRLQKFCFFTLQLHSVNLQKQVESRRLPKNRQKRQFA